MFASPPHPPVTRRTVRVDAQSSTELDVLLGEERGPNGEPSASDFLLIELSTIAERFDELLRLCPERDDYRYPVAGGRLVYAVVVVGQLIDNNSISELIDNNSISLFGIEIDLRKSQ